MNALFIVLADANFGSCLMHRQRFVEGAGFVHQYAVSLTKGVVKGFDDISSSFGLETGKVRANCQNLSARQKQFHGMFAMTTVALG